MNFSKLSIIVPCYNEVATIGHILDRIAVADSAGLKKEIIVVDDCSRDGSFEALERLAQGMPDLQIFRHPMNRGKGAALRTGLQNATGDILVIQDADLEYDPAEYVKMLKPILDCKADVVFGSRFKGGEVTRVLYFWHSMGNKFLTLLSNIMTDLTLTDMETCYKMFTAETVRRITLCEDRFGFEPEITAKLSRLDPMPRIYEVGINYYGRTYKEGKKINWKDGVRAIYCILRYNLFP